MGIFEEMRALNSDGYDRVYQEVVPMYSEQSQTKDGQKYRLGRKRTTVFISELLIRTKFSGAGKYWAKEVSLDYGTTSVKRVDFMQFIPTGQMSISDIEKGIFVCYEVKSSKEDFKSGYGQNFVGEKNYYVMPMSVYKEVCRDIPKNIGVMVPVPECAELEEELERPTMLTSISIQKKWRLTVVKPARIIRRKRAMAELLFCMLRSQ